MMRWLAIAAAVALVGAALVPITVALVDSRQARQLRDLLSYPAGSGPRETRVAVVYFSRSGNTALAARHIARRLEAALFPLAAPDYGLGLVGWARAMWDARGHSAKIAPMIIDLAAFDTVWLGSPIWLHSPAPPIWDFARNNRFDGKRVILFNTFNSAFSPEAIAEFGRIVTQNGARSFEHRFIRRGRMGSQLSPEEMLQAIDADWLSRQ
ncbi:flavodoxin family protein [Bosea sp. MMO-172]|uniref:flavodoxin family protein n=1 Tax=Bosea sp. MMO-172 TaxID=3127885 RepID=UPI00301670EB